uniref:Uncharacterized protein n=1 Tax=Vespula pensylvanica TaxID=30213 RepID=A0A834UF16_VESPE|nr:hypothetical protein H0235_003815 [Vespula pensylvanica]
MESEENELLIKSGAGRKKVRERNVSGVRQRRKKEEAARGKSGKERDNRGMRDRGGMEEYGHGRTSPLADGEKDYKGKREEGRRGTRDEKEERKGDARGNLFLEPAEAILDKPV